MPEQPFAGAAGRAADPWLPLAPLMAAHGVTLDPPAFFTAVNRAFHGCGARFYDELHRHMRESLPEQFQYLASDFLGQYPPPSHRMNALDIGCGTGMSSEMLLDTRFGAFVRHIDLCDPAQEMLDVCAARNSLMKVRHRMICGRIESLPPRSRYDLILASCVLQFVADLPEFLRQVAMRQPAGAVFLHLHDPNADGAADPECARRVEEFARSGSSLVRRLSRSVRRRDAAAAHVEAVNRELLERNAIASPLTEAEIAAVVRLRSRQGQGISIREMQTLMPEYKLVSVRSYAFFGELASALPARFRKLERALIAARAANGTQVGAIWIKTEGRP